MNSPVLDPTIWTRLEAEPGHWTAVEVTRAWLEALPPGLASDALDDAVYGRGSIVPRLDSALDAAGQYRWSKVIQALSCEAGDLDEALGKAVLFRAGLAFMLSSRRDDLLEVARASFEPYRYSEHIFSVHLGALLAADGAAKARLVTRLATLIQEGQTNPERLARRSRERELEPVPATTQLLWSNVYSQATLRHGWAYDALRAEPKAYASLLAALPVGLAHTTVSFTRDLKLDEISRLLCAAPPAFSRTGAPVSSGAVYALLEAAHYELANLAVGELERRLSGLIDAVMSRSDARWMARSWCQRLLWELSHRRVRQAATWPLLLFNALIARLKPLPEAQRNAWIAAENLDLWQVDRVLVEAAILIGHDKQKLVSNLLEWALSANLVTAHDRRKALEPNSFEANLIAQAFAGIDLRAWFGRVWAAGYPRRERCRVGSYRKIDDTARASIIWALAALNTADPDQAAAWDDIFLALREMCLLDQSFCWIGEDGGAAFRFAAALATALVAKDAIGMDRLTAFLDLVAAPTAAFAGCIVLMAQQSEHIALAAAKTLPDRRVAWALETGVLAGVPGKSGLNLDALERVKSFAAQLP